MNPDDDFIPDETSDEEWDSIEAQEAREEAENGDA